jgi:DNA polymerase-3 subunit delta
LLLKSKRVYQLKIQENLTKNIDQIISSYKPPIFWKDKEIVKQQVKSWSEDNIQDLIYQANNIELLIKKNSANSLNILSDFIITQSN